MMRTGAFYFYFTYSFYFPSRCDLNLNLIYLALQLIVFRWKQIHFVLYIDKIRFYPILRSASMIEIHFLWYVENVRFFLSQQPHFELEEKIKMKIKSACAHHFFNLQRTGNKKIFLGGLNSCHVKLEKSVQIYLSIYLAQWQKLRTRQSLCWRKIYEMNISGIFQG